MTLASAGEHERPHVAAIVVLYRSADRVAACLDSLEPHARAGRLEVVAVNNASPDDSEQVVRGRYPWVRVVRSPRNLGFAGGVNLGVGATRAPFVLLINPDATVRPNTLQGLAEYLELHPGVAAVGPKVVRSDGRFEPTAADRPTFANQVIETFGLFLFSRWIPAWRSPVVRHPPPGPIAVDVVTGCCMLIPRWAFEKVGPFDESFFMYVEDVDWCVRARKLGFEVHYVPDFEVVHDRGHGGANASLTPIDGGTNMERYFAKHGVRHSPAALRRLRRVHYVTRMIWMVGKGLLGQRGAWSEVRRFWRTLVQSSPEPAREERP